jgi:hypothetical protein
MRRFSDTRHPRFGDSPVPCACCPALKAFFMETSTQAGSTLGLMMKIKSIFCAGYRRVWVTLSARRLASSISIVANCRIK